MKPFVIKSAIPRTIYITPSVATNAGTFRRAIKTPLTAPTSAPSAIDSTATTQTFG